MDQFRYKIIEESWSKKRLCDYLLVLQKEDRSSSEQYILSFFEKLFALLVTSYMSQDLERGDNYLQRAANGFSNETLWKTATKISMNVPGVLGKSVTFVSVYLALGSALLGVKKWQSLRREDRHALQSHISDFLIVSKELPLKSFSNYVRWRDYSLTHKTILPLAALFPEFIRCIISFPVYDKYLDFITLIYSAHYYLYDEESSQFSDFIFDMLRSRDCKVNDRLYDDLCHSSFLYEIQTEYRDYCVRKNIKEQSLFSMDPPSPQEPVSPSGPQPDPAAPSSCGTSISKKDYFPNLSLDERKIRLLYNALIRDGFISLDTDYSVFHFRLSGKDKPAETSPVCWEKKKKELAYLIKRLTRKDIHDPDCKDATSNDVYSKTKKFFIVKGEGWRPSDNLSDMASKLNFADKETVDGLLDELFECS